MGYAREPLNYFICNLRANFASRFDFKRTAYELIWFYFDFNMILLNLRYAWATRGSPWITLYAIYLQTSLPVLILNGKCRNWYDSICILIWYYLTCAMHGLRKGALGLFHMQFKRKEQTLRFDQWILWIAWSVNYFTSNLQAHSKLCVSLTEF